MQIPTPLNTTEVMSVSRRAYRLHHARGQVATPSSAGLTRSSPGSASSVFGKTVMNGDMGVGADDDDEDHLMLCDSCGQSIVGVRYQCLSCPGKPISYNLVCLLFFPAPNSSFSSGILMNNSLLCGILVLFMRGKLLPHPRCLPYLHQAPTSG